nr:uncharacterized protein LOC109168701 [Ipomoea batatas]
MSASSWLLSPHQSVSSFVFDRALEQSDAEGSDAARKRGLMGRRGLWRRAAGGVRSADYGGGRGSEPELVHYVINIYHYFSELVVLESSGVSPEDEPNSSDSPTTHNSESPSTSQEPSTSNTPEDEPETDQYEVDIPTRTQKNHPIQNVIGDPSAGIRDVYGSCEVYWQRSTPSETSDQRMDMQTIGIGN